MNTENQIINYIKANQEASVNQLQEQIKVSRQMLHRVLSKMLEEGYLQKLGRPPKVFYRLNQEPVSKKSALLSLADGEINFLNEHFLIITELGKRLEGMDAMQAWCERQKLPVEKTTREFIATKKKYPDSSNNTRLKNVAGYKSLLTTLEKTKPLLMLYPDSLSWVSARCHAISSGLAGYVGHERQVNTCTGKINFYAESCDYGSNDPLEIIMHLLIDEGVPSLGHRNILLSSVYKKAGVSIQPHKVYHYTAVLDFYY